MHERETWTPPKLGAKEFEKLVLHRAESLRNDGMVELHRNGVKASIVGDAGGTKTVVSKSLPDFGGTISPTGRAIAIECKVCGAASFKLTTKGKSFHDHQYRHLARCARMGGMSYLLIHFNLNVMKTKTHEEVTVALPVHPDLALWRGFESGETTSIKRQDAVDIGIVVPWGFHSNRVKTLTPDLRVLIPRTEESAA